MSKSAPPPRPRTLASCAQEYESELFFSSEYQGYIGPRTQCIGQSHSTPATDAGGRLVAQSNPAGQSTSGPTGSTDKTPRTTGAAFKSDSISSPPQGEVIHSANLPKPGNTVLAPKLEGTSVSVSQPGPSNVGTNSSGMDGKDYFQ